MLPDDIQAKYEVAGKKRNSGTMREEQTFINRYLKRQCGNKRFKAQISGYKRGSATLTFEGFNGIPDPDDGTYDLLGAEIDWEFSSAPK